MTKIGEHHQGEKENSSASRLGCVTFGTAGRRSDTRMFLDETGDRLEAGRKPDAG